VTGKYVQTITGMWREKKGRKEEGENGRKKRV